jgi:hypothetical protein
MSAPIDHAVWPQTPIQNEVKVLVYRFFSLVDQNRPGVGEELASDVFTSDGIMITSTGKFKGNAGIRSTHL